MVNLRVVALMYELTGFSSLLGVSVLCEGRGSACVEGVVV